jgi:hypothetical protein
MTYSVREQRTRKGLLAAHAAYQSLTRNSQAGTFGDLKSVICLMISIGSPGWIRTSDHSINSRMLYR